MYANDLPLNVTDLISAVLLNKTSINLRTKCINMQKKPIFHLFVPYLLQSLNTWYQDFIFDVEAEHFSTLLTQFTHLKTGRPQGINSAFFHTLNPATEELPIAYYRHQVQLASTLEGLVCADPVHLEIGMKDVTLTHQITDLSNAEAKELIAILNHHFAQDGLQFIFGSNQSWYVLLAEHETLQSHDLDSLLLQNIIEKSICSDPRTDQRNWQVIQNETQMLLHGADVNRQREAAGLKPVNSLWFWGAGKPQNHRLFTMDKIYAGSGASSTLRGQLFCAAALCEPQALLELPETSDDMTLLLKQITHKKTATHVLLLEQLFVPAIENNLDDFQQALTHIDKQLIKPLLQAWKNNEIDIVIDCCDANVLKPLKVPAWKFYLKPQRLRELIT